MLPESDGCCSAFHVQYMQINRHQVAKVHASLFPNGTYNLVSLRHAAKVPSQIQTEDAAVTWHVMQPFG